MGSKAEVVDPQISGALVHHLTNHVHFHLQKHNNRERRFSEDIDFGARQKTAIYRKYKLSGGFFFSCYTKVCNISPSPTSCVCKFHIAKSSQAHAHVSHFPNGSD